MAWIQLAAMALGALQSAKAAQEKKDQQMRNNLAQSEIMRYSPWTKLQPQMDTSFTPSASSGAFQGAVTGLGMGQQIDGAFNKPAASPTAGMDSGQKEIYNGLAMNPQQQQPKEAFSKPWTMFGNSFSNDPKYAKDPFSS